MARDRDTERAERARARAARGMELEVVEGSPPKPALHVGDTPEERWAAMARLCRAASQATGRPFPTTPRSELPGEIFWVDDAGVRHPL